MSDIFFSSNHNSGNNQNNNITQSRNDYWRRKNEERQALNKEYEADIDRYSVNISQEDYNVIKDAIANADVPEDEGYRWACALELNKQYDIPVSYAYQNLENINQAFWGDRFTFTPKTNFKAIVDSGKLGVNTLKMGQLGSKIMRAEMLGTTSIDADQFYDLDAMLEKYAALEAETETLQDYEKRNFVIETLKFGAQSAPFTGAVAGAGLVGSLIAPGVGTAAAFAVSMNNAAGLEYMKLRQAGSTVGDAAGFAILSGGLQALVETSLGNVAGALGKSSLGDLATEAVKQKITGNVFKRLTYDGTFKTLALRMGKEWAKENAEEGLEEVIQDLIEKGTDALAAEIGGYEIDPITAKQVAHDAWENFRGGVMGSLVLGLGPSVIKSKADVKEFINVKNKAGAMASFEAFAKETDSSPVFEGLKAEEKRSAQKATWDREQARIEAEATAQAKDIAEVTDYAEGAEERKVTTDEEGNETVEEAESVYREDDGKLHYAKKESENEDGTIDVFFAAGDDTRKNGRYGQINYTVNPDDKTISIKDFKMAPGREGLRAELFEEFSRDNAGYKIDWNTTYSQAQKIKDTLIQNNPSGAKNGLNYYADENAVADASTRAKVAAEIRQNIHNVSVKSVKMDADGKRRYTYTRTALTNKQVSSAVALLEAAAKRIGMNLSDYVDRTFGEQIFGTQEDFAKSAAAQNDAVTGKAGGVKQGVAQKGWQEYGQMVKAVIYAGENADFSTWAHELAHVFQNQLDGDLKTQAEAAFGVQNGDWINSTFKFKDGHTDSAAEAFAYGFQDWLKTGKAESEEMKNIFKQFAEFLVRAFNSLKDFINLTPEITDVYNQLLSGDESLLKLAEKAVEEEDRRYRAQMQQQAEESAAQKKADEEAERKTAMAEKEEAGEVTDFSLEEEEEASAEEIEAKLDEGENESSEETNAIDNALENTNLTDEQKVVIGETLKNEDSTVIEKAEAMTEAASSSYDEEIVEDENAQKVIFQLAGEPSIRRMAESAEKERMLADLDAAKLLDERYKSMDAKSKASRIRMMTGWEKDASGAWKFELDDSINRIKGGAKLAEVLKKNPEILSDASKASVLNLGDIMDAPELFKVFPYMKSVRVSFYSDPNAFRAVLTPQGIKVNTRYLQGVEGEKGLKGVLAHEIQHVIQAMEFAESKGLQGENIQQLYEDMMKAMQAAGERKYDYDLTSLQNGLDAYMQDAGEIEARNVARRILMNADERRMKTLASTEDVKRPGLLFQEETDAEKKIDEVIQFAKSSDNTRKKENYGTVSKALSDNAKIHGFDIEGFSHSIDNYFIKHESKRNKNLTDEDFKKIPDVINNADYIIYGSTVKTTGNNAITYVKNDKDSCIFVEEIRNGKKTLAAQSMSKTSRTFNVQSIMAAPELYAHSDPSTIQIVDVKKEIVNPDILFQVVFHGSPFNFENFSTDSIGTGEGAQAFGWGLYFTNQEGIARFYADKLSNEPKRISLIAKNEYLKSRKKSLKDVENKEKYESKIIKNINHFRKELKQAQKEKDESQIKFYEGLIDDSYKQLDEQERLSLIESFKKDIANAEQEIKELKASMKNNRNLYTVEIPDNGYLKWDENVSLENIKGIKTALKDRGITDFSRLNNLIENQEKWKDNPNSTYTFGSNIYKVISDYLDGDKNASLFLKDLGYVGIDYPANTVNGKAVEGERNYVIFDEANIKIKNHLLYQKVYHGSGADFDKFDTENFGLSGEGSMSFGYGTYVTDNEDIARDYAERQSFEKDSYKLKPEFKDWDSIVYDILALDKAVKKGEDFAQAKEQILRNLKNDLESKKSSGYPKRIITWAENDVKSFESLNSLSDIDNLFENRGRHLYTVEIPDDGYLEWDRLYKNEEIPAIAKALRTEIEKDYSYGDAYIEWDILEELENHAYTMSGANLLNNIKSIFYGNEKEKKASKYLNRIGYAGIKYPAGTIHGNGNGAYNYVIFNDDDAKIVDKLLFQTQAELADEARTFDSWQEFMEYCEAVHSLDEVSPIPSAADAQWYQTFYETANGITVEQEANEKTVEEKTEREGLVPTAVDALFRTYLRNEPEMVDEFLAEVSRIDAIDLAGEEWAQVADEEDAKERERIEKLKDFITVTLYDYNWKTAMNRIQGGGEISEGMRKRLLGEMTDSFKIRDFRALYAEVMEAEEYAVNEEDTTAAILAKKLSKYKNKYDILKPNEDITRVSPERRKRIAEAISNQEIANKIRNGSLKMDDELYNYIKGLGKQIKEEQKRYDELEAETKADYQRLADYDQRQLLKLHDELLQARSKMRKHDAGIERKIAKGLKITEKYQRLSQNLKADYNELFRKFTDLKNTLAITADVKAALERQEQVAGIRDDLNAKQTEKNNLAEDKKMRIQLVKRTMRRVDFKRIDYNYARTIIAIQRMLEPNLIGGVNRFIGIDSPFLRGVISGIVTDTEYKEKILAYLQKNDSKSEAFVDFLHKIENLKSIKDFDSWTAKERKYAIKHLPKENWVRELNLMELAKEREESIDLDIDTVEKQVAKIDPKTGDVMTDKEGNTITETAFVLDYSEEIGDLVKDAVGADMFDIINNKPFAEWTIEEFERIAQRINELYTEGREMKAAKDEARRREYEAFRKRVEDAIRETGITINDDDSDEERERKSKKIAQILGFDNDLAGTEAGNKKGIKAKLDRLLHSYDDANILRVARILDNYSEGENVRLLYRMEDDCFNNKQRSMNRRSEAINKLMKENKITEGDLAQAIKSKSLNTEFTVDELLYFLAADKDYQIDEGKANLDNADPFFNNDDYAATSRNAVMFGNMMSDSASQDLKESYLKLDKEMQEAIENDTLTPEQQQDLVTGKLDKKPGTSAYIRECHYRWGVALRMANKFLDEHPEYKALLEAIEKDYAEQYGRMNELSINEFNMPVHRVKAYVPLVRRESNGDTNVNQVKEDLLGAYGSDAGKQWVNKGMTQRRVNISPLYQKPVQTGLVRTWGDSIERTEHFIAYAGYVRMLNGIYKSRDASYTRRAIQSRYGKQMLDYIDSYINEVANPNAGKIREKGAEWLHTLRGKTAPAYLGWKFSGIVKQGLTSPWPYMQFVNPAEYFAAATKCWTSRGKVYDAIREKSVYMKGRVMDPVNELVDEMAENAKNKFDKAWSKFSKMGMQGLEWIDWTCVAPGWLACYEKEYNRLQKKSEAIYKTTIEELTEKNMYADVTTSDYMSKEQIEAAAQKAADINIELEAVRYADDCTRACQPSSRSTDLAPMFKNSSEAMKAFLQFQTSLNVIWQNIKYDIPYNIRQKQFRNVVGTICGYVFAGIFMNSVMDGIGGDDDDDDTQALRNLIYYSTTQFTDAIPMIGSEITNTMDQLITGKRGYSNSGTDMTPSATKLLSAMQKVTTGDFKKAAELVSEGIGLYMGAPVSGTKEIYKLLGKPFSEGDVNLKRGVSDVYGIADDIIGE